MTVAKAKYLWLDIETTGLDPQADQVLEAAVIVTDAELNELGRWTGTSALYPKGLERLRENKFVADMHKTWIGECLTVPEVHWVQGIERVIAAHEWDGKPILAGASVHFDRSFLPPSLTSKLHYRMFDISSLKMYPELRDLVPKAAVQHRAMADIEHTLAEARAIQAKLREPPAESVRIPTLPEARAICRAAGDMIETHDDWINRVS